MWPRPMTPCIMFHIHVWLLLAQSVRSWTMNHFQLAYRPRSRPTCSQVSSNQYRARLGCERLRVWVPSVPMLLWKLSVIEIPLDKELTANCFLETRTKLELILAALVKYGLNRVQLPLWLKQSLINGFSMYGLS